MKKRLLGFLLLASLCIVSCNSPKENLINNGDFSSGLTNSWWNFDGGNLYEVDLCQEFYSSPEYSVKINADSSCNSFAHWSQVVTKNIPLDKKLKLKLKVKMDKVNGNGIAIAIRCDDAKRPEGSGEMFSTTQGRISIKGTSDWKEYEVTSDTISKDIQSVTIYLLMLDNTTGTVYFDDIVLEEI